MSRAQQVGRRGEDIAARYLAARGYHIVARNVRTPYGEIDLIARLGDELVFVEVKTRTSTAYGWPEEAVTQRKLAHLSAAALAWLEAHAPDTALWRVDVIAVRLFPGLETVEVRHFEDVLSL